MFTELDQSAGVIRDVAVGFKQKRNALKKEMVGVLQAGEQTVKGDLAKYERKFQEMQRLAEASSKG